MARRDILARQLGLLRLLDASRGLSTLRLAASLNAGRATIDRDLRFLREQVGIPIARKRVNGEVRHVLQGAPLDLAITPSERAALRLARHALQALAGTAPVRDLDALAASSVAEASTPPYRVSASPREPIDQRIVGDIDRAMERGKQIRVHARTASHGGDLRAYHLDPLCLRVAGLDTYLDAWSHERSAVRTFKVARIQRVEVLADPATEHPEVDFDSLFAGALKTWSGEETSVRVRLASEVAWAVREYPLSRDQLVFPKDDGSVELVATVAGLVEVTRWILSWGRHAEALEPPALRRRMAEELEAAAARYRVRSPIVSEAEARDGAPAPGQAPRSTVRTTQVREEGE